MKLIVLLILVFVIYQIGYYRGRRSVKVSERINYNHMGDC